MPMPEGLVLLLVLALVVAVVLGVVWQARVRAMPPPHSDASRDPLEPDRG